MQIEFSVLGKPPKKDGANSMWNKDQEVKRIIALRLGALKAMIDMDLKEPIRDFVRLKIDINLPQHQLKQNIGDLDNFVTGICDGLQAADRRAKIHPMFGNGNLEKISPKRSLLIENDLQVVEIIARKLAQDGDQQVSYKVVIETVDI